MTVHFANIVPKDIVPESRECSICLLPMKDSDILGHEVNAPKLSASDKIVHIFHRTCISRWFAEKKNCPECLQEASNAHSYTSMTEEERGEAVYEASMLGQLNAVRKLLANNAVILQRHRNLAVYAAAGKGHLEIIRELLANGEGISASYRDWAIENAADQNHPEIVDFLLLSPSI